MASDLDKQIKIIIKELDKGLLLLGIVKDSKAKALTQIVYKAKIFHDECYKKAAIDKLRKEVKPSKYKELPFYKEENGYIVLYSDKLIKITSEHRYVMFKHINRLLNRDEIVHHIDRNPSNNSIDNLQIVTKEEHKLLHRVKVKNEK